MEQDKWYLSITYSDAKKCLNSTIAASVRSLVAAGYYMKYIKDKEMYLQDGYKNIYEFAEDNYGIKASTATRWMQINDKFSQSGNSPHLKEEYRDFSKSKLQEMLYLTNEQLENVTPDMTVKEIRDTRSRGKEEEKQKKCGELDEVNALSKSESDSANSDTQEQLPGQMNVYDYPDIVPEENKNLCDIAQENVIDVEGFVVENTENGSEEAEITSEQDVDEANACKEWFKHSSNVTDLKIAKEELYKSQKLLNDILNCYSEDEMIARKQKIIVGALASFVTELEDIENPFEPEQPEFPILKNMEQREEFILNYRTWPVWCKNDLTEETYYRYNLPDGSAIVVREYPYSPYWRNEESVGKTLFLLKHDTKHFKDAETSMTSLKEHLRKCREINSHRKEM